MATYYKCPLCNSRTLRKHCENRTCTWVECDNTVCKALLSPARYIGHALNAVGKRVRVFNDQTGWRLIG